MNSSYCHIHSKDETWDTKPYVVCFECGHVYHTAQDLEAAYRHEVDWINENYGAYDPVPAAYKEATEIHFCQACMHDF